jgi:hypothetical protein
LKLRNSPQHSLSLRLWEAEKLKEKPSLAKVVLGHTRGYLILSTLMALVQMVWTIVTPLILPLFIAYLAPTSTEEDYWGYVYASCIVGSSIIASFLANHVILLLNKSALQIMGGLQLLIYDKVLKVRRALVRGKEGGREGGRERGREGEREGGREGGSEERGRREKMRSEEGRSISTNSSCQKTPLLIFCSASASWRKQRENSQSHDLRYGAHRKFPSDVYFCALDSYTIGTRALFVVPANRTFMFCTRVLVNYNYAHCRFVRS